MAAMLLPSLDDMFTLLTPVEPGWVLPVVFMGMTVAISALVERHTRLATLREDAVGAAADATALSAPAPDTEPTAPEQASADHCPDIRAELLIALAAVRNHATQCSVRLELAVPNGLAVGIQPVLLRPVLPALLRSAIDHAPGGRVFIGAMRAEGRVRLVIIDDGPQAAGPLAAEVRKPLARLLVLSTAILVVDHRPDDGTTVMLCLSEWQPVAV
jgi:signal transduction histidine kinase